MFMTFTEIVSDYAWLASDQNNVLSLNKTSDVIVLYTSVDNE